MSFNRGERWSDFLPLAGHPITLHVQTSDQVGGGGKGGVGKVPAWGSPSLCGQTQATSGPCPSVEVEGALTPLQLVPSVLKKLKSSFLRPPCS